MHQEPSSVSVTLHILTEQDCSPGITAFILPTAAAELQTSLIIAGLCSHQIDIHWGPSKPDSGNGHEVQFKSQEARGCCQLGGSGNDMESGAP